MKLLDSGYFYDVFDIGNNRVLKKKRSFFKIAKNAGGWIKAFRHIKQCTQTNRLVIKKVPHSYLGNPVFKNKTNYEQDKVVLLMDYFDSHGLEENKIVVDKYISLIERLLSYDIHDYVYKFKNSYGLNSAGEIVFIDFNEVVFDKNEVLKLVQEKRWQSEAQFRKFPEGELKNYIQQKFTELLTIENINKFWSSKV